MRLASLALSALVPATALALAGSARAEQKLLRLTPFPTVALADGKTPVSVSIEVRDTSGRLVPDGTRVILATTLGAFRESIVPTTAGLARAQLVAPSIAGVAKITATVLGEAGSPTLLEYEFVGDRKMLATAEEFVDVFAGESLEFTYDTRVLAAAGPGGRAKLRFRDVLIEADDLQYNVPSGEVRARKAKVRIGKRTAEFSEMYFRLSSRKGFGVAPVPSRRWDAITLTGLGVPSFVAVGDDGRLSAPPEVRRLGIVEFGPGGFRPGKNPMGERAFEFADLGPSASSVTAKRATVFPRKLINFQRADLRISGQRIMSVPLYQLSLTAAQTPIVTEQIVNVNNNQLAVNYPYYLTLGSNTSSLLRFTTGQTYGRALAANTGAYLNYELNWNRGDGSQGGLTYSGIGRRDWSLGARQFLRLDPRSTLSAQVEMPAGRALIGSTAISRGFDGFQATFSSTANRVLRGPRFDSSDATLVVEKDPIAVGRTPFSLFLGVTAQTSSLANAAFSSSQSTAGLRLRAQSNPISLDRATVLTTSFSVSRLFGNLVGSPTPLLSTTTISRNFGNGASALATYDLGVDGYNDRFVGRQRLSLQANYSRGAANFSFFGTRSLDLQRQSLYADGSYRMTNLLRVGYGYTLDQYLGSAFRDYRIFLGVRLGLREVGLVYSRSTRRIGVQLLSVPVSF